MTAIKSILRQLTAACRQSSSKIYLDAPYVNVSWQRDQRWVFMEWKACANTPELREAHELALKAIRENRASSMLVGQRRGRVIVDEDQLWMASDWVPRAAAAGLLRSGLVVATSQVAAMNTENITKLVRGADDKIAFFTTVEQAASWLGSHHD